MGALIDACRRLIASETSLADRYLTELTGGLIPASDAQPLRWVRRVGGARLEGDSLPGDTSGRGQLP